MAKCRSGISSSRYHSVALMFVFKLVPSQTVIKKNMAMCNCFDERYFKDYSLYKVKNN